MLVTRKTDYAVRCILYLAQANEQIANVAEVSRQMHIPKTFLAKIFQKLTKAGLAESIRGMNGGFRLSKNPADISLLDIMEAIQGPVCVNVCAVNSKKCSRSPSCSVHPFWVKLRQDMNRQMREQTITQLIEEQ